MTVRTGTLLIVALLCEARGAAAASWSADSLGRFHDPVIVSTALLFDLKDHRTAHYRLYSAQSGAVVAIPFQFDARDERGELILGDSPDSDAQQDFSFDDNDELVFMAKDSGERIVLRALPPASDSAREIEITDPVSRQHGWVYLLHFTDDLPARSPLRYAHFDAETNEVQTPFYAITYAAGRSFFTGMHIKPAAGGSGANMLDRMKIRVNPTFSLLLTTWSPLFTEEDFAVQIDGVKNGPVRAIRRVRQSLDLGKLFPDMPGGTVYTYYYFSSFNTPSKFNIPWMVLKALRSFRFVGADDFRSNVIGMTYWDGANPQGLRYTGHDHAAVNTTQDHDWWAVGGPGGTCLHAFVIPKQWQEWGIKRGTVFSDDDAAIDAEGPEAERGSHMAGYSLLNMANIAQAGNYEMNMAVFILPRPYRPGDEAQPLAMLKQPLQVAVHAVP
jgi:hypothetical protein